MINDEKVGPKGVKVRCRKCGYVILVKRSDASSTASSPSSIARAAVTLTPAPVMSSSDPEDATATQVMQTPTALDSEPKTEIMSNAMVGLRDSLAAEDEAPKAPKKALSSDSFLGADDDEIGAVFDQVLKTGSSSDTQDEDKPHLGLDGDRQHTRVLDAETAKKLADESGEPSAPTQANAPAEEVPTTDWYVAVNDKQTGPLTLEQIKGHWDKGEIGPDSLCWRAGYSDWLPLNEVKALASVLAPKPPKPIVVAAAATVSSSLPGAQAVMSEPVHSAFSSGGVMQSVQSEVQVPISAHPPEETGTWRPSAASALASLVKDEMDAMAKPAVAMREKLEDDAPAPRGGGLLDLPEESRSNSNGHSMAVAERAAERERERQAQPPMNPYMANPAATHSAPALTQYRPPTSRGLLAALIGGGVLLVALFGLVLWLALREPKGIVSPPVVVAPTPAPTALAPTPAVPVAVSPATNPTPAPAVAPPVAPAAIAVAPTPAPTAPPSHFGNKGSGASKSGARPEQKTESGSAAEAPEPKKVAKAGAPAEDDDGFGKAFGSGGSDEPKKAEKKPSAAVYIPPAPGSGGDIKDELATSDIFEVVVANKPAIAKCAEDQHKKDPGSSGKLVMKWTVQTNGRTSAISVASEELKGSYIANCIGGLVKTWTFPRHKKQGEPIVFPFKF